MKIIIVGFTHDGANSTYYKKLDFGQMPVREIVTSSTFENSMNDCIALSEFASLRFIKE